MNLSQQEKNIKGISLLEETRKNRIITTELHRFVPVALKEEKDSVLKRMHWAGLRQRKTKKVNSNEKN